MRRVVLGLLTLTLFFAVGRASAAPIQVFVGYADGLRVGGFFPNPWAGDPGVTFVGGSGPFDAGAIRIDNHSGTSLTISDVTVKLHPATQPGNTFDLWGSNMIGVGGKLILTETNSATHNFDTSDFPISPPGLPVHGGPDSPEVIVTTNLGTFHFFDTGHVLDTQGFDFAFNGSNESFRWRPIGGSGDPAGDLPEPASFALFGLALAGGGVYAWRRRLTGHTA
jgi:hypothetical protein